jgi:hypothetical protein
MSKASAEVDQLRVEATVKPELRTDAVESKTAVKAKA